jgi:hypothetical protein
MPGTSSRFGNGIWAGRCAAAVHLPKRDVPPYRAATAAPLFR